MSLLNDINTIARGCGVDLIDHAARALDRSPGSADTAHKSYMTSQGQKDLPHAGLGSVEAGTLYPVSCRARYYEAASKILEDELRLFTNDNTNELGLLIEQWLEKKRENWEPR